MHFFSQDKASKQIMTERSVKAFFFYFPPEKFKLQTDLNNVGVGVNYHAPFFEQLNIQIYLATISFVPKLILPIAAMKFSHTRLGAFLAQNHGHRQRTAGSSSVFSTALNGQQSARRCSARRQGKFSSHRPQHYSL